VCFQDHNILKDDEPIVQFVQNSVISAYLLTEDRTLVKESNICQMLMQHEQWSGRLPMDEFLPAKVDDSGQRWYTGKQVFSCILPKDFWLHRGGVRIENGVMLAGRWNKKTMNMQGGLIHLMVRDYGGTYAANFITGTYNFLSWYGTSVRGFTVALDDCYVPSSVLKREELKKRAQKYFREYPDHKINGHNVESGRMEINMCKVLDRVRDVMGNRAIEYFESQAKNGHDNGMHDLVESGAKGNPTNIIQVAGCIGQQRNHQSKRYPATTCHYNHKDSEQTMGHGMIFNDFMLGMDPIELFFHFCASRSGLVDTGMFDVCCLFL
jgi:DNA-directed RNA polymerase subunit A'